MDVDDRLEVKVLGGRNLAEVPGGPPYSYCIVKVGEAFEQTDIRPRTCNPVWGDSALTMVFNELTENSIEWVIINVMHKDMGGGEDMALGVCKVPLTTVLNAPYVPTEDWIPIQHQPGMPGQPPADSALRVMLTYFIGNDGTIPNAEDFIDDEKEARPPNMLVCSIGKARKLAPPPGKAACDAYVSFSVAGSKHQTKTVPNSNAPKFDDTFQVPVSDGETNVILKCKSRVGLTKKTIGVCKIPMVEIAACGDEGLTKWCVLQSEDYTMDGTERGEVEVRLQWKHDKKYRRSLAGMMAGMTGLFSGSSQKGDDAPQVKKQPPKKEQIDESQNWMLDEDDVKLSAKEMEELEEQRRDRVAMAETTLMQAEKAAEEAVVRPGDYQVQVHLIEARDLKGEDMSGLSDPYVRVTVMGKTKKTRVIKQVVNCVFDETLFFNFSGLTRQQVEEARISVEVLDYDFIGSHDMIGVVNFDMIRVYSQPGHELYRQWAGLFDPISTSDSGFQGFLKLSCTVLGPGDAQVFHDPEKEYQDELLAESSAGGGGASALAMAGPSVKKKLHFLVMYIWQADDLPKMGSFTLMGGAGIEAYVKCQFAGQKPAKTSVAHCRGSKQNLSPVWEEELWVPAFEPTFSDRITLSVWDRNFLTEHKPVAHCYFDYKQVVRTEKVESTGSFFGGVKYTASKPRWVNLYGAPLGMQSTSGFVAIANTMPDEASTYRGRLLVSSELIEMPPKKLKEVSHMKDFRFSIRPSMYPAMAKYQLRAAIILGSEIPSFAFPNAQGVSQMKVVVTVGTYHLEFPFKPNNKGTIVWNTLRIERNLEFPQDLTQLPDVIIYLMRGTPTTAVAFARLPAAKLIAEQFSGTPFWVQLKRDRCQDNTWQSSIDLEKNPGALLVRLGFGLNDDSRMVKWDDIDGRKLQDLRPYCLRVYVYQARNLPASDANGLLDPYVKVRFCGHKKKTRVQSETTSPMFYETLEFHEMLPADLNYAPDIILQVWDKDSIGSNTAMALLRMAPGEVQISRHENSPRPTPTWMQLTDIAGTPIAGQLLVSFQLVTKRDLNEKFNKPPDIRPTCRGAYIEVITLGVRNVKPFLQKGALANNIREPFVKMVVPAPGKDDPTVFQTNSSRHPRGRDANFITHEVRRVELPENPVFAPMMDIKVYDTRTGGLNKPLVGACTIPLDVKIPWNSEGYVAPLSDLFDESEAFKRAEEEQKRREEAERKRLEEEEKEDEEGGEDEEDDDDDEEEDEPGDDLMPELERKPGAGDHKDGGTGAFEAGTISELPMVHEDAVYQERLMKEVDDGDEGHDSAAASKGWFEQAEAALGDQMAAAGISAGPEEYSLNDLPINFPTSWDKAEYMEGRDWWVKKGGGQLEDYMKTKPFEGYTLYRGRDNPDPSKANLRPVGTLKAIIRILDSDPRDEEEEFVSMRALEVKNYTVRLYVVKASSLQPLDASGTSDPFLKVKLGDTKYETPDKKQDETLSPDFYQTFEFHTRLPGPSTMKLQVWDHNRFIDLKSHQLIGETVVDIEDRWFHNRWQELNQEDKETKVPLKPIEARPLYMTGTSTQQGLLQLWVEVLPVETARAAPPTKFEGPEPREYEVRVICWKSVEVPNMDANTSDLYGKFWLQGLKKQTTDTHWRCKNGKGSWNYRLKFKITLPVKNPEMARLYIQLWDADLIVSDVVGESSLDMYRWFLLAYQENRRVNIFREINQAIKVKKAMESGEEAGDEDEGEDDADAELGDEEMGGDDLEMGLDGDSGVPGADGASGDVEEGGVAAGAGDEDKPLLDKTGGASNQAGGGDGDDDDDDDEGKTSTEDDAGDAKAMINQFKELAGIGDLDDSAQWCVHRARASVFSFLGKILTLRSILSGYH